MSMSCLRRRPRAGRRGSGRRLSCSTAGKCWCGRTSGCSPSRFPSSVCRWSRRRVDRRREAADRSADHRRALARGSRAPRRPGAGAGRRRSRAGRKIVVTRRKMAERRQFSMGRAAIARRAAVRDRVWNRLVETRVNVGPAFDRIPNFVGADVAAKRLSELDEWRRARVIKCNPDPPQIPVRLRALYDGKLLFSPVPYLDQGLSLSADRSREARRKGRRFRNRGHRARLHGARRSIGFEDMPKLDFCVVGCVAVTRARRAHGKGRRVRRSRTGSFPRARACRALQPRSRRRFIRPRSSPTPRSSWRAMIRRCTSSRRSWS